MELRINEFIEGVRAMSGLPSSLSGGGTLDTERQRFDKVISNIVLIEFSEVLIAES